METGASSGQEVLQLCAVLRFDIDAHTALTGQLALRLGERGVFGKALPPDRGRVRRLFRRPPEMTLAPPSGIP
jgi:hypothetical protein